MVQAGSKDFTVCSPLPHQARLLAQGLSGLYPGWYGGARALGPPYRLARRHGVLVLPMVPIRIVATPRAGLMAIEAERPQAPNHSSGPSTEPDEVRKRGMASSWDA